MHTWRHSHNLKQTTWDRLKTVIEELRQEKAHIEVQGRALTAEELAEVARIDKALPLLDEAWKALVH